MKSITYEEFKRFNPCWLSDKEKARKLEEIGAQRERWTALDVLGLPEEEVSAKDKFWAVLRPEFIEEPILHEFACRCAEEALKLVDKPDPRSVAAIQAKRDWLARKISDEGLRRAREEAYNAYFAAYCAARAADCAAAHAAASAADWAADLAADLAAARAAECSNTLSAYWDARDAARNKQVEMLRGLMEDS